MKRLISSQIHKENCLQIYYGKCHNHAEYAHPLELIFMELRLS